MLSASEYNLYCSNETYRNRWCKKLLGKGYRTQGDLVAADSNLAKFTSDGNLSRLSEIKLDIANSFYWLFANACKSSVSRLKNNGYSLEEILPLQECLCAIYRGNTHDSGQRFFHYLKMENSDFVLNNCANCRSDIKINCRLFLPQLDGQRLAEPAPQPVQKILSIGRLKISWGR